MPSRVSRSSCAGAVAGTTREENRDRLAADDRQRGREQHGRRLGLGEEAAHQPGREPGHLRRRPVAGDLQVRERQRYPVEIEDHPSRHRDEAGCGDIRHLRGIRGVGRPVERREAGTRGELPRRARSAARLPDRARSSCRPSAPCRGRCRYRASGRCSRLVERPELQQKRAVEEPSGSLSPVIAAWSWPLNDCPSPNGKSWSVKSKHPAIGTVT
jgi:hypothetical protein